MQIKLILATLFISLIFASLAIYTSFLPKLVPVEVKINVNQSSKNIKFYLNNVENWGQWIVGDQEDIDKMRFNGKSEGKGAVLKWWSAKLGDGALELIDIQDTCVSYQMISDNNLFRQKGTIYWKRNTEQNLIVWRDTLDISTNLVGRWTAGEKFTKSLQKANYQIVEILVQKLSQMPNSNL
jgi:hypothetical protein